MPIAFVNDHIETLHELDIEYAEELGAEVGAERIARCAAPNTDPIFIECLADLVSNHLKEGQTVNPQMLMTCPMCTDPSCKTSKMWWAKVIVDLLKHDKLMDSSSRPLVSLMRSRKLCLPELPTTSSIVNIACTLPSLPLTTFYNFIDVLLRQSPVTCQGALVAFSLLRL